jgi:hypothetical protein
MKASPGSLIISSVILALVISQAGRTLASQADQTYAKPATTRQSLLGMTLSASANEDFFTFFRLEETMRARDVAGREVVVFKPGGGTFRKLVTVRATLGPGERIVGMELHLSRSFIDSPAQRPFANDIASSMLISSLPREDVQTIKDLIIEIQRRSIQVTGSVAIPRFPPTELPSKESLGYLTYAGKRNSYIQQLPTTVLLMEKMQQAGEDWLRIRLSPKS